MLDFYTQQEVAKLRREELLREVEHDRLIAQLSTAQPGRHRRAAILARLFAALRAPLAMLTFRLLIAQRPARQQAHGHPDGDEPCCS